MKPVLTSVARRIASQCVDDAVQCALIKVWRNVGYVDLSREATVKALVMKIGVRAMRDEVRKVLSKSKESGSEDLDFNPAKVEDPRGLKFYGDVLEEYVKFYEENGTFVGVHVEVARRLRKPVGEVQAEARREARAQAEAHGLEIRSLDDVFDSFIRSRRIDAG
jgi:sulfite reductase beta subunit-like hemoprotein